MRKEQTVSATSDQVVITGAGLAGLVTAYELHERGIPSIVLEAADHVGGRVRTVQFDDGARAEAELEKLWESNPAIELARRFGLPLVEHPTQSSFLADGELHLIPSSGRSTFAGPQWMPTERDGFERWSCTASRIVDELDDAQRSGRWSERLVALQRTDLSTFVAALALPDVVATWIRLTVESETGVEWDRIAALDGIDDLRPFLVDDGGRARQRRFSIDGGNTRLIDELLRRLPRETVQTGALVKRVVDEGDAVSVTHRGASGQEHGVRGRYAVVTTPVWTLRDIDVQPALSSSAQAAIMSTASGSYVKVILRLGRGVEHLWERFDGRLFALLSDALPGCVYLRDGGPTRRDHVLIALVHGSYARGLHDLPERLIASSVISGLQSLRERVRGSSIEVPLFPGISEWVTDVYIVDCPPAVAYWPHALRRSRFDALASALRNPHGRILIGGDTTDSSHSDGAMRAATRMANWITMREQIAPLPRPTDDLSHCCAARLRGH